MTEEESLVLVRKYLENLGYPTETVIGPYDVRLGSRIRAADLVVKLKDRVIIVVEVKTENYNINSILKELFPDSNKLINQIFTYAKALSCKYFIISNSKEHVWFRIDENEELTMIPGKRFDEVQATLETTEQNYATGDAFERRFKQFKGNFYIVGGLWENDNEFQRYIPYSAWKTDVDARLLNEVRSVNRGDVIIFKSDKYDINSMVLNIRGMGRVLGNNIDEKQLEIEWQSTNIQVDIRGLKNYYEQFARVDRKDVYLLFQNIGFEFIINSRILEPITTTSTATTGTSNTNIATSSTIKIAGLLSDSEKGVDYLDITKDVTAFARVIAAKSFEPPLAIALFGKWGSGKSFFMRKLKEQIDYFSEKSLNGIYCKGVVHIHFNAWSYMDANLWASIVTRIFEGLNEYISKNSKTDLAKKEIEKQLTNTLAITKEEVGVLETKKNVVSEEIKRLEKKREEIRNDIANKIKKIQTNTVSELIKNVDEQFVAKEKIIQSLRANNSFIDSEQEVKKVVPEKYWNNPEAAYNEIKSKHAFLREFFRRDKIGRNLLWLIIILTIIFLTPVFLTLASDQIKGISFAIPQAGLAFLVLAGSAWKRGEKVYNQLQPLIASFWKIKEDYEKQVSEAVVRFEQEEKALKLEIDKGKGELLLIEQQIQNAESVKTDLEFRINSALATETLYSFIDRRSSSEDYKKHLGIISIIRNDLEILNDLFYQHNQEASKAEEAERFKSMFAKPLERIILYIDDLDRCAEENVVQVLEAVNLLMAFPLFIVVVGVDSRWVKNALIKKHALQFTGRMTGETQIESAIELIEPSNYLEKIFQVPFHLKDAKNESVKDMIKKLSGIQPVLQESIENDIFNFEPVTKSLADSFEEGSDYEPDNGQTGEFNIQSTKVAVDKPEALILTEQEVSLMQDMSEVIGNNPRAIKRFVNIYRIIKAHEEFNDITEPANEALPVILFLLALPLGKFRKLLPSFEKYVQNEDNAIRQLTLYLQPLTKIGDDELDKLKNTLYATLSNKKSFGLLQNTNSATFNKHNEFIRRFTFKNF